MAGGLDVRSRSSSQLILTSLLSAAMDPLRNRLFVAGFVNRALMIDATSGAITTLAGSGDGEGGYADGPGRASRFNGFRGVAVDRTGTLLAVPDGGNGRVRTVLFPTGDDNSIDTRYVLPGLCEGSGQRWHHFAVTLSSADDQTLTSWYVDGEPAGTPQPGGALLGLGTSALQIGGQLTSSDPYPYNATPSAPFSGAISELRIYSRALGDGEISMLAQPFLPIVPRRKLLRDDTDKVFTWVCLGALVGPVVELRKSPATNGWVWTRAQGFGCSPPAVAVASDAPVSPAIIAASVLLLFLLAGMVLYVVQTRLRVRRQLEQLTMAKTTLDLRAMDRARLLALLATPQVVLLCASPCVASPSCPCPLPLSSPAFPCLTPYPSPSAATRPSSRSTSRRARSARSRS